MRKGNIANKGKIGIIVLLINSVVLSSIIMGGLAWTETQLYADTKMNFADVCRELGILKGQSNGVDTAYLYSFTTRMQAIYITLRLSQKESEAVRYIGYITFNDAKTVNNVAEKNILSYLRVNPQYGWNGDLLGNILPNGLMTAQEMYKVILTILGYRVEEDYTWAGTLAFARQKGFTAAINKKGNLTNSDFAAILVETLKTRPKNIDLSLCEILANAEVIDYHKAYQLGMIPGSSGYRPTLSYKDGGPLVTEVIADHARKSVTIKFNTSLNPSYAKAIRNYQYFVSGIGYVPLPYRCSTNMPDENTVIINFPADGWTGYEENIEKDAYTMFIATANKNELRISGLVDVDGMMLKETYLDIPQIQTNL